MKMKITFGGLFGPSTYESSYEPTPPVTWPWPAPIAEVERDRYRAALQGIVDFAWEDGKDPRRVVNALKRRAERALTDEQT